MTHESTIHTAGQLGAVNRQLSVTDIEDGVYAVATMSQTYDTTVDHLWQTCTTSEELAS